MPSKAPHPVTVTVSNAKLTEEDVVKIRALRKTKTQAQLAQRFGVSRLTINNIQNMKTWTHVIDWGLWPNTDTRHLDTPFAGLLHRQL